MFLYLPNSFKKYYFDQLCYGSSFFKGLSTGGNVSAAMAIAGETAVYGSFISVANQLLLLGNSYIVL